MDGITFNGREIKNLFGYDIRIISKFTKKTICVFKGNPVADFKHEDCPHFETEFSNKDITSMALSTGITNDNQNLMIHKVSVNDQFPLIDPALSIDLPPESDSIYYLVHKHVAFLNTHRKDLIFPTKSVKDEDDEIGYFYLNMFIQ